MRDRARKHREEARPHRSAGGRGDVPSRALFEHIPSMYFALAEDGVIVDVNLFGANQLGYSVDELLGNTVLDVFHPDDKQAVSHQLKQSIDQPGRVFRWRFRKIRKNGSLMWVEEFVRTIQLPDGFNRTLVVCQDITGRIETEQALRDSEERFRAVVEQSQDCILLVELDTRRVIEVNAALERLLGYSRGELLDMTLYDFVGHGRDDIDNNIRSIVEEKGRFIGERVYLRKDGRRVRVDVSVSVIHYGGREVMSIVSRDIEEQVRAREERQRLEKHIRHTQKMESLGLLAGGVAHDFNNLLAGILSHSELALLEVPSNAPATESLKSIRQTSLRAAELCEQLLAYSGKGQFIVGPVSFNDIIEEMVSLLEVSISKKVTEYEMQPDLPMVDADSTQMRQVIMNLITNAAEAMPDGGVIRVVTKTSACDRAFLSDSYLGEGIPEGDYVCLEISDSGSGMNAEERKRMFDPFYTTKFTGRGLGLAAVLGIVRGHRGTIHVGSEPGTGTTVCVLLPISDERYETLDAPAPATGEWRGAGTVLFVDDEETLRGVARKALERLGFDVITAENGRDAIEKFRETKDDLSMVILDMTMPDLSGEETFRELQKIRSDVPVILSSGYSEQKAMSAFEAQELAGFIRKPYQLDKLTATIKGVLKR